MKVLTAIYLDKRRMKSDNTYPLKLRISNRSERRYYATGIDVTLELWQKVNSTSSNNELKKIRTSTTQILNKVDGIIKEMGEFSFIKFESIYLQKESKCINLREAFEGYISRLNNEGRASTSESYTNAMGSILTFKPTLEFEDITPALLREYEIWMLKRERTLSTIGIYLRSLRTLINIAIEDGILKRENYPFGKRKYQIPMGQNIKKSLTKEEVASLYYFKAPEYSQKDRARDLWFFSYLANGMNFKDICKLKFSNIHNDTIIFQRSKTVNTRRGNPIQIMVVITEDIKRIMKKWGNEECEPNNFIFPFFTSATSPQKERQLVKQLIKVTNNWLEKIAKEIGIKRKVTTYAARHSFSTILKNEGASIQYIKESLGHNSTQTTENYLNGFPDNVKRSFAAQLTSFITEENID